VTPRAASATRSGELLLEVRLTPRAAFDRIDGLATLAEGRTVLLARVRAVPEDGRANEALCRLIADAFGVAKSSASVVSGHTARLKRVRLTGDPERLSARLAALPSVARQASRSTG
jgi:uncharacterized protein YggU (UPF0235/DUF167 family)